MAISINFFSSHLLRHHSNCIKYQSKMILGEAKQLILKMYLSVWHSVCEFCAKNRSTITENIIWSKWHDEVSAWLLLLLLFFFYFDQCKWFINSFALTRSLTRNNIFGDRTDKTAEQRRILNVKFKYIEINYLNYNLCEQKVVSAPIYHTHTNGRNALRCHFGPIHIYINVPFLSLDFSTKRFAVDFRMRWFIRT